MTKEQKIDRLLQELLAENPGYASIQDPVNEMEKRKLLRTLVNVRFPRKIEDRIMNVEDELLQEELSEKGVVDAVALPAIGTQYPCSEIKNDKRIYLWKGDITQLRVDAIVNAANAQLLGCFVPCHGCIDNVIHTAAGMRLRQECGEIMEHQGHEEPTGKAKITRGYNLPAKHIIHTVGPIIGGAVTIQQEKELESCYRSCLKLAEKNELDSIAFCCISTGEFHFPNKLGAEIAMRTIDKYLSSSKLKQVVINVYKDEDLHIYQKLLR